MWRIFRPLDALPWRRKAAWQAAVHSLETVDDAFRILDSDIKLALVAKNRAMRLDDTAAQGIDDDWDRMSGVILNAQQMYSHLKRIEGEYNPRHAWSVTEYQNRQSRYASVEHRAKDITRRLNAFTTRCQDISFSPTGLRKWVDLELERAARLERLRQNMTTDGPGLPQGADIDELHALVREAEVLLQAEDYAALVHTLLAVEQLVRDIEDKFKDHLRAADHEQTRLADVTRMIEWTQRYLAATRVKLNTLRRDYGEERVWDVAEGLDEAPGPMALARTALQRATALLQEDFQSENVSLEFETIRSLCWEVEQLCEAVDGRQRELEREHPSGEE